MRARCASLSDDPGRQSGRDRSDEDVDDSRGDRDHVME
jgi:hypothetical protein